MAYLKPLWLQNTHGKPISIVFGINISGFNTISHIITVRLGILKGDTLSVSNYFLVIELLERKV
jgi:hypothetical protein